MGALQRLERMEANYRRALSQSVMYEKHTAQPTRTLKPNEYAAYRSIWEIIQRGDLTPLPPDVDKCIAETLVERNYDPRGLKAAEQSIDLAKRWALNRRHSPVAAPLNEFDDEVPNGARKERWFWDGVQNYCNGELAPWIHPQPYLSALGVKHSGEERSDFLICPPWATTKEVVWEIHGDFSLEDKNKSNKIRVAGWDVFDQVVGEHSQKDVGKRLRQLIPDNTPKIHACEQFLIDAAWLASQVDLALSWLLTTGRWTSKNATLHIQAPEIFDATVAEAVTAWFAMVKAAGTIWQADLMPLDIQVTTKKQHAAITLEIDPIGASYFSASDSIPADYCVRRFFIPMDIAPFEVHKGDGEIIIYPAREPQEPELLVIMQRLFAKDAFRLGQVEAIQQAVTHKDGLILLPTGYGKSLVFQMAAMMLPGVTLVIEPFKALIDDQVRNLQDLGFGGVLGIHSGHTHSRGKALVLALQRAQIIYIAAERLHDANFASELTNIARNRGLDLFVVDEAHTVSQFGHSFRPAYLDLIERLELICGNAGARRPCTLALTATSSQRVSKDIRALLRIETATISLEDVKPNTFARNNLHDEIYRYKAEAGKASPIGNELAGIVCRQKGKGVVFCPTRSGYSNKPTHIRPALFGANGLRNELQGKCKEKSFGIFVGGDPKETSGAINVDAKKFSEGELDVMVATSAFGTGIDIQNVRWTAHVGLPGGLESYYQETGRAGRDGKTACNFLFIDEDGDSLIRAIMRISEGDNPLEELRDVLSGGAYEKGSLTRQLGMAFGKGMEKCVVSSLMVPGYEEDDSQPDKIKKDEEGRHPKGFYKPSFPGLKWETENVDWPLITKTLASTPGVPFDFECHQWWKDVIWKSINRLATLGVVQHGFTHSPKNAGDTIVCFSLVRSVDADTLNPSSVVESLVCEIERISSPERTLKAREKFEELCSAPVSTRKLLWHASEILLREIEFVVYETRVGSMRSLLGYVNEPNQSLRRQLLEDYFAPSQFKKQIFDLCRRMATIEVLDESLKLAQAQAKWRKGIFEVAMLEFPGAILPVFLRSVTGIVESNIDDAAEYLYRLIVKDEFSIDIRSWCYLKIQSSTAKTDSLDQLHNTLCNWFGSDLPVDVSYLLGNGMEQKDGELLLASRVVSSFLGHALGDR